MQLMTPQSDLSWMFGALRFFVPAFFFLFLNQSKTIEFFLISHKSDPCELVCEDDQNGMGARHRLMTAWDETVQWLATRLEGWVR
jgi:hypothetical protein